MRRPAVVGGLLAAGCLLLAPAASAGDDPYGTTTQPTTSSGDGTAGVALDLTVPGGDPEPGAAPVAGSPGRPTRQTRTVQVGVAPCAFVPGTTYAAMLQDQVRVPPGGWQPVRTYCAGEAPPPPAPPQPDPDVARAVAVSLRAEVRAPRPRLLLQPAGGVPVNQPGVLSLGDPGAPPTARDADPLVPGLEIVVELGAPTYAWTWGDGTGGSSGSSRGRPYAPGDVVPAEGRGAPLVTHTWTAPGPLRTTVTAVYPVTWRWNGTGGTLPAVRATSSADVTVRAARSELVRGWTQQDRERRTGGDRSGRAAAPQQDGRRARGPARCAPPAG